LCGGKGVKRGKILGRVRSRRMRMRFGPVSSAV